MKSLMHTILYRFAALLVILSVVLILGVLIWSHNEKPPLRYVNVPFVLDEEEYHAGDTVLFDVVRCVDFDLQYSFTEAFVPKGGKPFHLPGATVSAKEGCITVKSVAKVLPDTMPPGTYRVESEVTVNGITKSHNIDIYTEWFEVKPSVLENNN